MQLHCHEHDEHRVSGVCALTGEEGDCHGGAFFVERGGFIHHERKAIPTMGTREDGSLVGGYLCDAQQHGVVFDSHALRGTRVLHACIAGTHAGSGCCAIPEPWIPVDLNNVGHCFHLLMWCCMHGYFLLLLSIGVAFSLQSLKVSWKGAVASNVEEEAKKKGEEEEEEPTNDLDDPNEEEEPTNDAHEEEECKEVDRVVVEDGVPQTWASLRLKDLDKRPVPMQLEMEKDSECDKEWVVCCGYDAMLLRGSELDDAPRSEWTKATRPGWRMLIMPPQLPEEDDISLVAVKKFDCEKTYEEAEVRRVQSKADAKV